MLKISTIPNNNTLGNYEIFIGGLIDGSPEGGQVSEEFSITKESLSFKEAIKQILLSYKNDYDYYYPSYHDIWIVIKYNGNNIEEEYSELLKETKKLKNSLTKNDYNDWCAFVVEELTKKEFLYSTVKNLTEEIFTII